MKTIRNSWFKENKDWVLCNAVYGGVLAFGITEFGLIWKLLNIPELKSFLNILRVSLQGILMACILIIAAILAYAFLAPFCDWILYIAKKNIKKK